MEEQEKQAPVVEERIDSVFMKISEALDVPVEFASHQETQKVKPHFDINAMVSKMTALLVYCGLNVPLSSVAPTYNRVHADVEYWKRKFEDQPEKKGS